MKLLLQHNTVFKDGDLAEAFLLGLCLFSAGNLDHKFKKSLCSVIDGLAAAIGPASKSIQPFFLSASWLFVASFKVGAGAPNGVPRPVVNRIMCAPAAVMAVADTRSLPGP